MDKKKLILTLMNLICCGLPQGFHRYSGMRNSYRCFNYGDDGDDELIPNYNCRCIHQYFHDEHEPVLSISPQWLNPGEPVTLRCQVEEKSIDWKFFWYRTDPYNDKDFLVPLSVVGTTEEYYTLSPAGQMHTGGYVCRAGRSDVIFYQELSNPQYLCSGDQQSAVSLTVNTNITQHFTSTSISLSCEEKGRTTEWSLVRYTDSPTLCFPYWRRKEMSTCNISYTQTEDSGVYWCESGSGENSNAVNITVTDGPVILESPVHPVTDGDTVTLVCKHRTTTSNITTADFYKDGELFRNETTGQITIPVVSKSDEGFYKCKSNEGESLGSWVTVRGSLVSISPGSLVSISPGSVVSISPGSVVSISPGSLLSNSLGSVVSISPGSLVSISPGSLVSISLLSRLLCGLLVVFPFLLVSIILMVKCYRAQDLCSAKMSQDQFKCDYIQDLTESSM